MRSSLPAVPRALRERVVLECPPPSTVKVLPSGRPRISRWTHNCAAQQRAGRSTAMWLNTRGKSPIVNCPEKHLFQGFPEGRSMGKGPSLLLSLQTSKGVDKNGGSECVNMAGYIGTSTARNGGGQDAGSALNISSITTTPLHNIN